VAISFTSDASSFRWAAVIHLPSGTLSVGDYWSEDIRGEHINVKEMWAVLKGLQSLPEDIRDCRIDAQVDNMVGIHFVVGAGTALEGFNANFTTYLPVPGGQKSFS